MKIIHLGSIQVRPHLFKVFFYFPRDNSFPSSANKYSAPFQVFTLKFGTFQKEKTKSF